MQICPYPRERPFSTVGQIAHIQVSNALVKASAQQDTRQQACMHSGNVRADLVVVHVCWNMSQTYDVPCSGSSEARQTACRSRANGICLIRLLLFRYSVQLRVDKLNASNAASPIRYRNKLKKYPKAVFYPEHSKAPGMYLTTFLMSSPGRWSSAGLGPGKGTHGIAAGAPVLLSLPILVVDVKVLGI
jgi:hypothetical protein